MAWKSSEMVREKPKKTQKLRGRSPKEAQKWSETSPKRSEMVWEQRAEKSSEMVWEKPKTSSEMVWDRPKKARKWSGRSPKRLRNGWEDPQEAQEPRNCPRKATKTQKWSGRSPKKLGKGGGGKVARAIVLGFGSLPLTLKGSTALTASVGLALPWSIQQPQLYLGCTFSALRSLAKLGQLRALKCW